MNISTPAPGRTAPTPAGSIRSLIAAALLSAAMTLPATRVGAQCVPYTLLRTVPNPAPAEGDNFGYSVASFGTMAVVGAWTDDPGGISNNGSVHIFNSTTGATIAALNNPVPAGHGRFGNAVAISGNMVVVGAHADSPGGVIAAGTAYVFNATTGALIATLNNPFPLLQTFFGTSVAISENVALVGTYNINVSGRAHLFNATTGALTATMFNPQLGGGDFGFSVAISGTLAVVGARLNDPGGMAYVYNAATGALITALSNPAPTANDNFGESVAISGNLAVVGAPRDDPGAVTDAGTAYVFNATTGALGARLNNPVPTANDYFGKSVGISGNLAVVGAFGDNPGGVSSAGTAYIFDATTGALIATLNSPSPAANDWFGGAVAISGNTAVVGAYRDDTGATDAGSVYLFSCNPVRDYLLGKITDPTGLDLNLDGVVDIADELALISP